MKTRRTPPILRGKAALVDRQFIVVVLSLLAIAVSLFFIVRRFKTPPRRDANVDKAVQYLAGETVANEVVRLLNGQGQIGLVSLDSEVAQNDLALRQFKDKLRTHKQLNIAASVMVPMDPEMLVYETKFGIPAHQFQQLLVAHPGLDAIVSFVGVPLLTPQQLERLNPPPIVCVSSLGVRSPWVKPLLTSGRVAVAIVPNPDLSVRLHKSWRTIPEKFAMDYAVLRPETANLLPDDPTGGTP